VDRRPVNKLKRNTTNATTSRAWIRPPPICIAKPISHSSTRMPIIVYNMALSLLCVDYIRWHGLYRSIVLMFRPRHFTLTGCSSRFRIKRAARSVTATQLRASFGWPFSRLLCLDLGLGLFATGTSGKKSLIFDHRRTTRQEFCRCCKNRLWDSFFLLSF
jgi:hypothetical protein